MDQMWKCHYDLENNYFFKSFSSSISSLFPQSLFSPSINKFSKIKILSVIKKRYFFSK